MSRLNIALKLPSGLWRGITPTGGTEIRYHNSNTSRIRSLSGEAVLRSKPVDGRCRVHFPAFRSFLWFLRISLKYGLRSLRKTLHGEQSTYCPRSHKQIIRITSTTNQPRFWKPDDLFTKSKFKQGCYGSSVH